MINEMRKLMEKINDAAGIRDPKGVMQYVTNKRQGGNIKPGFTAFFTTDKGPVEINSITIIADSETGKYFSLGEKASGRGWKTYSLGNVDVYKLEKVT